MICQSFNSELYVSTIQMCDIFNHIQISARNGRNVKVQTVFGNRSRIFKDLENPNKAPIKYPLITIKRTGLSRDTTRVNDINENLKHMIGSMNPNDVQSNPINIQFQVTIFTKRQSEMERIIGNFLPWFNGGDIYVRVPHPKIANSTMNLQVVWDGEVDEDWPFELGPENPDTKVATINFTMKTALFAGTELWDGNAGKLIESVNFTLTDTLSGDSTYPNLNVGGFYPVEYLTDIDGYYDDIQDGTVAEPSVDEFIVSGDVNC